MNLIKLKNAVAEVCPINEICIGNESDKSTWKPDYKPEATEAEKAAAQAVIDAADLSILADIKYISKLTIVDRLEAMGERENVKAALAQYPYMLDRWNAATEISTSDAQVRNLFAACGIDPDLILY